MRCEIFIFVNFPISPFLKSLAHIALKHFWKNTKWWKEKVVNFYFFLSFPKIITPPSNPPTPNSLRQTHTQQSLLAAFYSCRFVYTHSNAALSCRPNIYQLKLNTELLHPFNAIYATLQFWDFKIEQGISGNTDTPRKFRMNATAIISDTF